MACLCLFHTTADLQDKLSALLSEVSKLYDTYHALAMNFQSSINHCRGEHTTKDDPMRIARSQTIDIDSQHKQIMAG